MGIFKVSTDGGYVIVRARCISCARGIAADNAGSEGPRIWRDYTKSTVQLIRACPDGRAQLLERHYDR